jgi:ribosome biogenesis protein BRX1
MTSVLKVQRANAKGKRKALEDLDSEDEELETEPAAKKNKQRVLLLSSRGITYRMRHLIHDLEALLPHVKKGTSFSCFFLYVWV